MSITESISEPDGDKDLREVVEEVVAEETAELHEELNSVKQENRQLKRALATVHREQSRELVTQTVFRRTLNQFADALSDTTIDDHTGHPLSNLGQVETVRTDINELFTTIDDHASALDQLGHGKPEGRTDAWNRIVDSAQNLHGEAEHTVNVDGRYDVVLYWQDIKQATGYSERYCKKLISVFGDEDGDDKKRGAKCADYEPPSNNNKNNERRKRLYIDLDVWGDE